MMWHEKSYPHEARPKVLKLALVSNWLTSVWWFRTVSHLCTFAECWPQPLWKDHSLWPVHLQIPGLFFSTYSIRCNMGIGVMQNLRQNYSWEVSTLKASAISTRIAWKTNKSSSRSGHVDSPYRYQTAKKTNHHHSKRPLPLQNPQGYNETPPTS